jgi:hypothetical protein
VRTRGECERERERVKETSNGSGTNSSGYSASSSGNSGNGSSSYTTAAATPTAAVTAATTVAATAVAAAAAAAATPTAAATATTTAATTAAATAVAAAAAVSTPNPICPYLITSRMHGTRQLTCSPHSRGCRRSRRAIPIATNLRVPAVLRVWLHTAQIMFWVPLRVRFTWVRVRLELLCCFEFLNFGLMDILLMWTLSNFKQLLKTISH